MLKYMTIYFLTGYVLPPLVFLLWNRWVLSSHSRKILTYWQRRETAIFREWRLDDRLKVEDDIRDLIKKELQHPTFFAFLFLLNLLLFPAIFVVLTLGTIPWLGWVLTLVLLQAHAKEKKKKLLKDGIPYHKIVTHPRVQDLLRVNTEYRGSISYPYLFIKSYHRVLSIPDDITLAIRNSDSVEEGQQLIKVLTQEEDWLIRDMNTLMMGRLPAQYVEKEENENSEALKTMLAHASDSSLPVQVRYRAMELAKALQSKKTRDVVDVHGFNRQQNAELDILTVEKYYVHE